LAPLISSAMGHYHTDGIASSYNGLTLKNIYVITIFTNSATQLIVYIIILPLTTILLSLNEKDPRFISCIYAYKYD
jgi:hypothetical protein